MRVREREICVERESVCVRERVCVVGTRVGVGEGTKEWRHLA